jgi:hypothetical protein
VTAAAWSVPESFRPGHYARRDVEIGAPASAERPLELSLTLPFGALFSALLVGKSYRIKSLALDYIAPDRLGSSSTFSARVAELDAGGASLRLSLIVSHGAWVCVRGAAVLDITGAALAAAGPPPAPAAGSRGVDRSSNGKLV